VDAPARSWRLGGAVLSAVLATGCASDYVARTATARTAYETGAPAQAAATLQSEQKEGPERDRLLALMDLGMVLHVANQYQKSIEVLAQADKLASELEVTSISEEALTLLTTERMKAYRAEDFEKLTISVLQALNYAQLGMTEDAVVEARRVNERILKMVRDEKKPYQQLAIARYISAVMYESAGNLDSAFIDYQSANELNGGLGPLAEPLLRLAMVTQRTEQLEKLKKAYPGMPVTPLGRDEGQLVVVLEAGRIPEKVPTDRTFGSGGVISVPTFKDRPWRRPVSIVVDAPPALPLTTVTSLEVVAKVDLDHRIGGMIAKQVGGAALKGGLAAGAGAATDSAAVGVLTFLALSALNTTDLRSWLSLPAEFILARVRLKAGTHQVYVPGASPVTVEIQPGRIALLIARTF
jgi:uncharacterized protein